MILILLEETVGFVHDIWELCTGKTFQYYMIFFILCCSILTTIQPYHIIINLKDEFAKAIQNKSPAKMTAIKKKPSHFDRSKTDAKLQIIERRKSLKKTIPDILNMSKLTSAP